MFRVRRIDNKIYIDHITDIPFKYRPYLVLDCLEHKKPCQIDKISFGINGIFVGIFRPSLESAVLYVTPDRVISITTLLYQGQETRRPLPAVRYHANTYSPRYIGHHLVWPRGMINKEILRDDLTGRVERLDNFSCTIKGKKYRVETTAYGFIKIIHKDKTLREFLDVRDITLIEGKMLAFITFEDVAVFFDGHNFKEVPAKGGALHEKHLLPCFELKSLKHRGRFT